MAIIRAESEKGDFARLGHRLSLLLRGCLPSRASESGSASGNQRAVFPAVPVTLVVLTWTNAARVQRRISGFSTSTAPTAFRGFCEGRLLTSVIFPPFPEFIFLQIHTTLLCECTL